MSNQQTQQTRNQDEIGAIWQRTSSSGLPYYSGKITLEGKEHNIVLFKNDKKQPGSKQADWRILLSNAQAQPNKPAAQAPQAATKQPAPQQQRPNAKPAAPRPVAPRPAAPRPVAQPQPAVDASGIPDAQEAGDSQGPDQTL